MDTKNIKIHQLKGKSKQNPQPNPTLSHKNSKELIEVSQNVIKIDRHYSKPILIRYIDPRLVPIFKEFNTLTTKCQQIVEQTRSQPEAAHQEEIEELLKSTKKINEQFHQIIDENEEVATEPFKGVEESQNCAEVVEEAAKLELEVEESKTIEEVDSPQDKFAQLERENNRLRIQLQSQKKKSLSIQTQNKELKSRLNRLQKQKKQILQNIKTQLYKLKDDKPAKATSKSNQVPEQ